MNPAAAAAAVAAAGVVMAMPVHLGALSVEVAGQVGAAAGHLTREREGGRSVACRTPLAARRRPPGLPRAWGPSAPVAVAPETPV